MLWIKLGQVVRGIHQDTWVDSVLMKQGPDAIVISDLRFLNEAHKIHELGGFCVRVDRPDAPPPKPADHELLEWPRWDYIINNDGTLSDLHNKVEEMGRKFGVL
jgi:hypothetical protein